MISHPQNDDDGDDGDCFEEDGCTFDFQDDTEASSGVTGAPVFRVYEGEDFGQYLDDDAHPPPPPSPWELGQGLDPGGGGAETADNPARRPKSTVLLREKIGRLLLTGGGSTGRSKRASVAPPQVPSYSIHEVSFADCKMGSAVSGTGTGSDSGIDCRSGYSLETESDLGPQRSSTWWDVDTLSSRRQGHPSSASALELRQRPSASADSTSGISRPQIGGRQADTTTSVVNDDVIIRRQQQQQQKSSDASSRASSDGVKRLSNPLRMIYNTLNRRKSTNLQQELTPNRDYEDIRL